MSFDNRPFYLYSISGGLDNQPESRKFILSLANELECHYIDIITATGWIPSVLKVEKLEHTLSKIRARYGIKGKGYGGAGNCPNIDNNIIRVRFQQNKNVEKDDDLVIVFNNTGQIASNYPIDDIIRKYGYICFAKSYAPLDEIEEYGVLGLLPDLLDSLPLMNGDEEFKI